MPIELLGRGEECDFRLEDESVADMACVFVQTDGTLLLRDLGTGSIRVNDQPVRRAVLLNNDVLGIAGSRFEVHYEEETDESGGRYGGKMIHRRVVTDKVPGLTGAVA